MDEKRAIERATAEAFLSHYNREHGTSFQIVEHGDAPDIVARNQEGNQLQLEIVLTEDRPRDIQAALGRSDSRSPEALRRHLEDVRAGRADPLERVSNLERNVSESLMDRLRGKMMKRYGPNTALVIRDTSGVDWDWDFEIPDLRDKLAAVSNPFDEGVWILNRSKDRLFRVL